MVVEEEGVEEGEELLVLRGHVSYWQLLLCHRQPKVVRGRVCGDIRGREGEGMAALFQSGCTGLQYRVEVLVIGAHGRTSKGVRVRQRSGDSRSWDDDGRGVSRLRDPIPAAFLAVEDAVDARAGVERGRR